MDFIHKGFSGTPCGAQEVPSALGTPSNPSLPDNVRLISEPECWISVDVPPGLVVGPQKERKQLLQQAHLPKGGINILILIKNDD